MPDYRELLDEFKSVISGSNSLLDSLVPPVLFLIINIMFGFQPALWASLGIGAGITLLRLFRKQKPLYALGGLGAALLAIGLRYLLNSAQAFFLPTLINSALTIIILIVSIIIQRPAVAFTSAVTRRWPLGWYWHPRVRPAYTEVTAMWVVYSIIKLAVQLFLYRQGNVEGLAVFNLVSGWPTLILLLILSYLYGMKRLNNLKGPSVQEFINNSPAPWGGQQRGF
jgi:hypothetical protein